jgi:hypothetical protein
MLPGGALLLWWPLMESVLAIGRVQDDGAEGVPTRSHKRRRLDHLCRAGAPRSRQGSAVVAGAQADTRCRLSVRGGGAPSGPAWRCMPPFHPLGCAPPDGPRAGRTWAAEARRRHGIIVIGHKHVLGLLLVASSGPGAVLSGRPGREALLAPSRLARGCLRARHACRKVTEVPECACVAGGLHLAPLTVQI